jgi:hypothetical protein
MVVVPFICLIGHDFDHAYSQFNKIWDILKNFLQSWF